jgi:ascorbate-specific PTS system EIIC-type component UlaA
LGVGVGEGVGVGDGVLVGVNVAVGVLLGVKEGVGVMRGVLVAKLITSGGGVLVSNCAETVPTAPKLGTVTVNNVKSNVSAAAENANKRCIETSISLVFRVKTPYAARHTV